MREITTHHDGHGLLDKMVLYADAPGPGGASHCYDVCFTDDDTTDPVLTIQFQKGPRYAEGSMPGILEPVLLAIVYDRLAAFEKGPFANTEGSLALHHVHQAMAFLKARADERARRGVLGTTQK